MSSMNRAHEHLSRRRVPTQNPDTFVVHDRDIGQARRTAKAVCSAMNEQALDHRHRTGGPPTGAGPQRSVRPRSQTEPIRQHIGLFAASPIVLLEQ